MGNDKWISCASCYNYFYEAPKGTCRNCEKEGGDSSNVLPSNYKKMLEE